MGWRKGNGIVLIKVQRWIAVVYDRFFWEGLFFWGDL